MGKFTDGPNPWMPMTDVQDIRTLGKFIEELGECSSAASRCLIQGIDETEPSTGKSNRRWLEEEIADVLTNISLVTLKYGLDTEFMEHRVDIKTAYLRRWHEL